MRRLKKPTQELDLFRSWDAPLVERGWGLRVPELDVREDAKSIRVSAHVPGMEKKDVHVSARAGMLTISAEKKEKHERREKDLFEYEQSFVSFNRSVPLPRNADTRHLKTTFDKGTLEVVLHKR